MSEQDALHLLWGDAARDARTVEVLPRGAGASRLLGHAARRTLTVAAARTAALRSRRPVAVWPRSAPELRPTVRDGLVRRLAGGVVLVPADAGSPQWRAVLGAAGATPLDRPAVGMGGDVRVRVRAHGATAMLRVGRRGSPADPSPAADVLSVLAEHGTDRCPRVLGAGVVDGWAWTTESLLPGNRPRRLDPALLDEVARWVRDLPPAAPGTPPDLDPSPLVAAAPGLAEELRDLARRTAEHPCLATAVTGHGDLWSGNLLVQRGRLSGVVDWDAASMTAAVGVDLVHLVLTQERLERRVPLGALLDPDTSDGPAVRRVLAAVLPDSGRDPDDRSAVVRAWWLSQVAADLRRVPARAADDRWVADNVTGPVRTLLR